MHGVEALLANGEARNLYQRGFANAAIGGKQNGEETRGNLSGPALFGPNLMNPNLVGSNFMSS